MKQYCFLLFALLCSGCGTTSGPTPIFNAKGPTDISADKGLAKEFLYDHQEAVKDGQREDPTYAMRMVKSGFSLIYVNCDAFFQTAGESQKWILFSRDTVGAVGTLASAILSLQSNRKHAPGNVALATGAAFAGLDIYTKNFLFAAENVSSVQELTLRALSVHQQAVLNAGVVSYDEASMAIVDNQQICSPMYILALTRDAIKKGTIVADKNTDGEAALAAVEDEAVLRRLGARLNGMGSLSLNQAGMLWWLYIGSSSLKVRKTLIFPALSGLPAESQPLLDTGLPNPAFNASDVIKELDKLSARTKATFRSVADAKNLEVDGPSGGPAAVAGVAPVAGMAVAPPNPVVFALPVSGSGSRFTARVK